MTHTVLPGTVEQDQWLADLRRAESDRHIQNRALDSYEAIRARARAAHGEHAAEPMPTGTSFTLVGRRLHPDER